jgi:hypothetical protein
VIVEGLQLVRSGMTVKTRAASPGDIRTGPEGSAAVPASTDTSGAANPAPPATPADVPDSGRAAAKANADVRTPGGLNPAP